MKKLLIIFIVIIVIFTGCTMNSSQQKVNEIPSLSKAEALNIVSKVSGKYHQIKDLGGYGIENQMPENKDSVEVNGFHYKYLSSSIDTVEELNTYLNDVLTEKSIESLISSFPFIVKDGKILKLNADAGGGKKWSDAEIISITQNNDSAEVEFKVNGVLSRSPKIIKFKYIFSEEKGWRIDTDSFFDLY